MSLQVQLRGGTMGEHREFVGEPREVTVDTTMNTLRVHDGVTPGGKVIATHHDVVELGENVAEEIRNIKDNLGGSHNHDDKYARIVHEHNQYPAKPNGATGVFSKVLNGHHGFIDEYGSDGGWYRSTRNGFLPYQPGGYGSIGSHGWEFDEGHFNNINAKTLTVKKDGRTSSIEFPARVNDPGFIRHIEDNNVAGMYFSVSDDFVDGDRFVFGATPGGEFQPGSYLTADGLLHLNRCLRIGEGAIMFQNDKYVFFNGEKPDWCANGSISFG